MTNLNSPKEVTVYTVNKEVVYTYSDHIEQYHFNGISDLSYQSGEYFSNSELKAQKITLPVRKFYWNTCGDYIEKYVAFDEELLELIDCHQDAVEREIENCVARATKPLYSKLERYETMSFWKRLVWAFKGEQKWLIGTRI